MTTATIPSRLADLLTVPAPTKVYSYARFSTPEQAKGDSFRRQTESAERWAQQRGLKLDDTLSLRDEGVSAFRGCNSTDGALGGFLQLCQRGLIERGSFLLVESLDRLSRMEPILAQQVFSSIVLSGVTIVTLSDGQEYSQESLSRNPTGLMLALMVAVRAHEESAMKARRVAAAWAEKRRKVISGESKRLTKRGPTWLLPDADGWREDPAKAAIVRRVFAMTLSGEGEHSIAKLLNNEAVPVMGRGSQWHRSAIAKLLRNPAVIGTLVPGRIDHVDGRRLRQFEQAVPGHYPAVVSDSDWLAVRAMKDGSSRTARGRHAQGAPAHILAGLAKCPDCGTAMTRVSKGSSGKAGKPKLVCTKAKAGAGCSYVSVAVQATEAAVLGDWGALMAEAPAGTGGGTLDREYADKAASILGVEDLLTDLSDALASAPSALAAQRLAKVEAELRLLRGELAELEERRRLIDKGLIRSRLGDLADLFWKAEEDGEPVDVARVNAALKVLFSGVTVDHRAGVLRFHWRQSGETSMVFAWPKEAA